ncbi:MAG: hypothetical protein JNM24_18450 [Bdellovibrionaceae bacterium]|jgi:hypothetical protein|nr:hypothetical protein [Pseudobdellovibrionaceae bacterium]
MKHQISSKFSPDCSTWNMFFALIAIFFAFILSSCEQKDPKPELKDSIYQDMIGQLAEAERIMKEMETKAIDARKMGDEAKINTGVKEKAERQAIEFDKTKLKMAQQVSYWKIRSFERLKHVRTLASKQKEAYTPDLHEWEVYLAEKKLRVAKNAWDLKARFKETGFDYNPTLMGENPADVKKEQPKPATGGGAH